MSALNDQDPYDTEAGLLLAAFSSTLDVIDEEQAHQFGIETARKSQSRIVPGENRYFLHS